MQVVLLSGGSGKRLWPLSNDARSKQFLCLLESPSGERESMMQRVVRQAKSTLSNVDFTFATNYSQRDSIINQLGDNVNIVAEPERRNTFPAILLAASYLHTRKSIQNDEVVVVMPCDVYADDGYFETIENMSQSVENGEADLVLMGIKPSYPSEKFGYIVPDDSQSSGKISRKVKSFVEKPKLEIARELLADDACWNGGVFVFKLGYILDIAKNYLDNLSFDVIKAGYHKLPKNSFDYEVVEKASSVSFVKYDGKWKDLGTWNSLCEELPSNCIGNVSLGHHNSNLHVINELGLPLFCDGLNDVVVAASPDGIMVCSKERSEAIKVYVENLVNRPMYEERRWGYYRVLDTQSHQDGTISLTKSIVIKEGKYISYQLHRHRTEVWTVIDGIGELVLNGARKKLCRGDVVSIPKNNLHAIKALTDLSMIEVQTGSILIEEDVERVDWQW